MKYVIYYSRAIIVGLVLVYVTVFTAVEAVGAERQNKTSKRITLVI